jgi:hypothetical protein
MPSAIAQWQTSQICRLFQRSTSAATVSVDAAAAAPQRGHDQPNALEPCKALFAMTGKKVAGMI